MERTGEDISRKEYPVSLSEEECEFLELTITLSGKENGALIQSNYTGTLKMPSCSESLSPKTLASPEINPAYRKMVYCDFYYEFSYFIPDSTKLTVGDRDLLVGGMLREIHKFWDETEIEELLKMTKADIRARLEEMAENHSSEVLTITIDEVGFETMDERELTD